MRARQATLAQTAGEGRQVKSQGGRTPLPVPAFRPLTAAELAEHSPEWVARHSTACITPWGTELWWDGETVTELPATEAGIDAVAREVLAVARERRAA